MGRPARTERCTTGGHRPIGSNTVRESTDSEALVGNEEQDKGRYFGGCEDLSELIYSTEFTISANYRIRDEVMGEDRE